MTRKDTRQLVQTVSGDRMATLVEITNQLFADVSPKTVRRAQHATCLFNRVVPKKPFLGELHMAKRL